MADDEVLCLNIRCMKILLEGRVYSVETEDSELLRMTEAILPQTMQFRRNGNTEFVAELPEKPVNDARRISHIMPDEVYYYEGWNVLCLNYAEGDISPYTVSYIGKIHDTSFSEILKAAENELEIRIEG